MSSWTCHFPWVVGDEDSNSYPEPTAGSGASPRCSPRSLAHSLSHALVLRRVVHRAITKPKSTIVAFFFFLRPTAIVSQLASSRDQKFRFPMTWRAGGLTGADSTNLAGLRFFSSRPIFNLSHIVEPLVLYSTPYARGKGKATGRSRIASRPSQAQRLSRRRANLKHGPRDTAVSHSRGLHDRSQIGL